MNPKYDPEPLLSSTTERTLILPPAPHLLNLLADVFESKTAFADPIVNYGRKKRLVMESTSRLKKALTRSAVVEPLRHVFRV
jgi:hypothetical protein